ncbi:MAG: hypothetical protein IKW32_08405 [Bacteroidaceae bacterium]|nr:hypothetical protein [Bacteroidaceae bacterium]
MEEFSPQKFWDNLDMTRALFLRWSYMSFNFKSALITIAKRTGKNKDLLNAFLRTKDVGPDQKTAFNNLRRTMDQFYVEIYYPNKGNKQRIEDSEMKARNFGNEEFKVHLRSFSELLVYAFPGCRIPELIKDIYESAPPPKGLNEMMKELEELSIEDLADNPGNRAPVLFVIDNSLPMQGQAFDKLQVAFDELFEELKNDKSLLCTVELYIATCGGGPTEIVSFATIDIQKDLLDNMDLQCYGRCLMGQTIKKALDRLDERIHAMKDGEYDVAYYTPWLIILSDGKFKDEMEEVYTRIDELKAARELLVYPKALSNRANMESLRRLDDKEASRLESVNGFFKDIFKSLKTIENKAPGGDRVVLVHQGGFQS